MITIFNKIKTINDGAYFSNCLYVLQKSFTSFLIFKNAFQRLINRVKNLMFFKFIIKLKYYNININLICNRSVFVQQYKIT